MNVTDIISPLISEALNGNQCIHYNMTIKNLTLTCKYLLEYLVNNEWSMLMEYKNCNWCGLMCNNCWKNNTLKCEKCVCASCRQSWNVNNQIPIFSGKCFSCAAGLQFNNKLMKWEYPDNWQELLNDNPLYIKTMSKDENEKVPCVDCICIGCGKNSIFGLMYCYNCYSNVLGNSYYNLSKKINPYTVTVRIPLIFIDGCGNKNCHRMCQKLYPKLYPDIIINQKCVPKRIILNCNDVIKKKQMTNINEKCNIVRNNKVEKKIYSKYVGNKNSKYNGRVMSRQINQPRGGRNNKY